MKKKISIDKLALDKETISKLDEQQLKAFAGGGPPNSISCNQAVDENELEWDSCCNASCNKQA